MSYHGKSSLAVYKQANILKWMFQKANRALKCLQPAQFLSKYRRYSFLSILVLWIVMPKWSTADQSHRNRQKRLKNF